jgi:hypothetical protein
VLDRAFEHIDTAGAGVVEREDPVVVDRLWNVLRGNRAMDLLMAGVPAHLLEPRPNVFRLALHPDGLAARLVNVAEVRGLDDFTAKVLRSPAGPPPGSA